MTLRTAALALILPMILAACGSGEPSLMNHQTTREPNEFLVVPAKPLQTPPDAAGLPVPLPGAQNRADATPMQDAVVALGGRPSLLEADGPVPAGDSALVAHASRYGRDPAIRTTTAAEDAEFRRRNQGRVLERVFSVNRYFDVYDRQALDQQAEIDRLRRAGVRTSSAPPASLKPR